MSTQFSFNIRAAVSSRTDLTCATWFHGPIASPRVAWDCLNRLIAATVTTIFSGAGGADGSTACKLSYTSSVSELQASHRCCVSPASPRASTSSALSLSALTSAFTVATKSWMRSSLARTALRCSKIAMPIAAPSATVPTTVETRSNHSDRERLANQIARSEHMRASMACKLPFGDAAT